MSIDLTSVFIGCTPESSRKVDRESYRKYGPVVQIPDLRIEIGCLGHAPLDLLPPLYDFLPPAFICQLQITAPQSSPAPLRKSARKKQTPFSFTLTGVREERTLLLLICWWSNCSKSFLSSSR
jgi:hypothetical protein